jgi:sRNA-binding regulator protein Hfq
MNTSSTIYTMGTALNRAQADHVPVALLVEGHWLHGHVVAVDGHGVILSSNGTDHSVVRMDSVAAVRVTTTDNTHNTLAQP